MVCQLTLLGLALAGPARSEDIVDVLRRSQQHAAGRDGAGTATARAPRRCAPASSSLRAGPAQRAAGRAARDPRRHARRDAARPHRRRQRIAGRPARRRAAVRAGARTRATWRSRHWLQMGQVYRRWVPGEVTPQTTDPVAGPLGREASGLSHRQEFEADAYALRRCCARLGRSPQDAFAIFTQLGRAAATPRPTRARASVWLRCAPPRSGDPRSGSRRGTSPSSC